MAPFPLSHRSTSTKLVPLVTTTSIKMTTIHCFFTYSQRALLLSVAVLAAMSSLVSAQDDNNSSSIIPCDLDCLHDTQCVRGDANFTWHPARPDTGEKFDFTKEISRHGWHCGCPPGFTGIRCGRKYESCNDGTHTCFNGGQCIATMEDIYQNDQLFCDCPSEAKDYGTQIRYSGKYCEVEVVHKDIKCTENNNICQNGGTCKEEPDELDPCDCPSGYVGRVCEFFEPSVPKCTLKCHNGGSCRYGSKTENHTLVVDEPSGPESQSVEVVHQDYQYCECPEGFMGSLCDKEEIICGNIKCLHGTKCISIKDEDTDETTHHCDCTEINKKKLAKGEEVQFSGRHCEIESSVVCHYDDDKSTFCAHNGTCPALAHENCNCLKDWRGTNCQWKNDQDSTATKPPHETCSLKCKNGGNCRKGSKNDEHVQELLAKYGSELGHLGLNVTHNKDVEHCACPDGYVGLECEYSMKSCGKDGNEHPCFAGSECSMVNGVPSCVCSSADSAVAGIYCQHQPSDVCVASNKAQIHGNQGFCTNGGVCVTNKDGDAVCRCHSDFEGPHCEYSKNASTTKALTAAASGGSNSRRNMSSTGTLGVILACMTCATAVAFGVVVYRRKRLLLDETADVPALYPDLDNSLALDDNSLRSSPMVDVGPEKDFDGNELKDVEFT